MQRAFTLIEILYVLLFLGIFGVFSGMILLEIYKNYQQHNVKFLEQLHIQNALSQIKRILEASHLKSLHISNNTPISNTPHLFESSVSYFLPETRGNHLIPRLCVTLCKRNH